MAQVWYRTQRERANAAEVGEPKMNPSEEFLKHARECELMAKFTRDPDSRATWSHMAQRWVRCAQLYSRQTAAAHERPPAKRHRHSVPESAYV
jgi:hypothetical protein